MGRCTRGKGGEGMLLWPAETETIILEKTWDIVLKHVRCQGQLSEKTLQTGKS